MRGEVFKMKLTGAAELKEALQTLPMVDDRDGIARAILKAEGKPMLDMAKALAPVLTGELRSQTALRAQRLQRGDVTVAIGVRKRRQHVGRWMEFGTKFLAPRPFLRPAWDQFKGGLIQSIGARLWDAVRSRGGIVPADVSLDVDDAS